jgi:hypothetical protein
MPDFTPLPIHHGVGNVHINRFRVVVRPTRTAEGMQEIAADLWRSFPDYLTNHNTASVERTARMYSGWPTLKFRGVARIRPFSIPIVIGGVPIAIPVPASVRDWMMPDLHTDWVGVVAANGANGFTVQTLRRHFEDEDDAKIRIAIRAALVAAREAILAGLGPAGISLRLLPADRLFRAIEDFAIAINQMHFLAGRRAWRFDRGSVYGYPDEFWTIETAAVERFSNNAVVATQIAVGNFQALVRDIWVTFLRQFMRRNGLTSIDLARGSEWTVAEDNVICLQTTVPRVADVAGHAHWGTMSAIHRDLMP